MDEDEAAITVDPGDTGELTYTFDDADEVLIGCHQPGHYDAGMKVTVNAAGFPSVELRSNDFGWAAHAIR